ncbi:MAG: transporter substrate-binding domain-containing protein [Novosphingobium sp.]|jgi:lysine/arginine/ornithine transport system substrate-binding protein|uniref:transporter substrate-binding domain-containing protein n=1 Tax=Novosphingobium sp. TaxID=1874826 RepID=UPI0022C3B8DC|nr:transporter substrate-binding domain-containing protein [Novosphingobium sp.]MCZ8036515.1 transporter substrate-binding domain-containing protein [Novosphingobium sp.]
MMMFTRSAIAAAILALAGLSPANVAPAMAQKMSVATEASYPPFSRTEPNGTYTGFEIDLGNEVCKRAGFECSWVKQDFDGAIAALNANKFDMIFSAMSIRPERRRVADFSIPYYRDPSMVFARKGTVRALPGDLNGKTLGVYAGSVQDQFARANFSGANVRGYQNIDQITADLRAGRLDAMFVASLPGTEFVGKPEGAEFEAVRPAFTDKALGEGTGAMMRQGDPRLARINEGIRAVYADGTYERLQAKWFPAGTDIGAKGLW